MKSSVFLEGIPLQKLADAAGGVVCGNGDLLIRGLCAFDEPFEGCISYSREKNSMRLLDSLKSLPLSAMVVNNEIDLGVNQSLSFIKVSDPWKAIVRFMTLFLQPAAAAPRISSKADIDSSANIGSRADIRAFAFVGHNCTVGADCVIHPHAVMYDGSTIGDRCVLHSGAVLREGCTLGSDCVVQNGAVIGSDGFGYVADEKQVLRSIPQLGTVSVADRVDVGANTCIDRATLGTTSVGFGAKLDNLVQIGHNAKLGKFSIYCGQVGVAGSCAIGDGVTLGGQVGVADHLSIVSGSRIAGGSSVLSNITEKGDYCGYPAITAQTWKRSMIGLYRSTKRHKRDLPSAK